MKQQIIAKTHGKLIEKIHYFFDKEVDFIVTIMPELKPLKIRKGDTLYVHQDHCDELYMIM